MGAWRSLISVLGDPNRRSRHDAILLLAPRRANDEPLKQTLASVLGKIKVETMRVANLRADRSEQKETPEQASNWLSGQIDWRR